MSNRGQAGIELVRRARDREAREGLLQGTTVLRVERTCRRHYLPTCSRQRSNGVAERFPVTGPSKRIDTVDDHKPWRTRPAPKHLPKWCPGNETVGACYVSGQEYHDFLGLSTCSREVLENTGLARACLADHQNRVAGLQIPESLGHRTSDEEAAIDWQQRLALHSREIGCGPLTNDCDVRRVLRADGRRHALLRHRQSQRCAIPPLTVLGGDLAGVYERLPSVDSVRGCFEPAMQNADRRLLVLAAVA